MFKNSFSGYAALFASFGMVLAVISGVATGKPGNVRMDLASNDNGSLQLIFPEEMGEHDDFSIEAHLPRNMGSTLHVGLKPLSQPLLKTHLSERNCRQEADGSVCHVRIASGTNAHALLVRALRQGLIARVELHDPGLVVLKNDVALDGFEESFRSF